MALTNPGIDYETIITAIRTILRADTTTLNDGLDARYQFTKDAQIDFGNVGTPVPFSNLPSVLIDWSDTNEDFSFLGADGNKRPVVKFDLIIIGKNTSGRGDAIIEKVRLLKNVGAVLRKNIDLSSTVLKSNPAFSGAGIYAAGKSTYVNAILLTLECEIDIS